MNTYQQQRQELENRTVQFSVSIIKKLGKYSNSKTVGAAINQIIRSSSSIGANYAEANNSSSRADFKNKIFIAKKEAAETRYWIKVLKEVIQDENLDDLEQEAIELNLILQKIISTMKKNEK